MFWASKPEQKGKRKAKYTVRIFISGAEEQGANDHPESDAAEAAAGANVLGK